MKKEILPIIAGLQTLKIIELHPHDTRNNIRKSIENLESDFNSIDHVGPMNVAWFIFSEDFEKGQNEEQDQILRQSKLHVENLCAEVKTEISWDCANPFDFNAR